MTMVALLWCWWTERNKANHNERWLSADEFQFTVRRHVRRHDREWAVFIQKKQAEPKQHWQPPIGPRKYLPLTHMMMLRWDLFSREVKYHLRLAFIEYRSNVSCICIVLVISLPTSRRLWERPMCQISTG